jgi:hypothetical protein
LTPTCRSATAAEQHEPEPQTAVAVVANDVCVEHQWRSAELKAIESLQDREGESLVISQIISRND